jgi:hypothetical protein
MFNVFYETKSCEISCILSLFLLLFFGKSICSMLWNVLNLPIVDFFQHSSLFRKMYPSMIYLHCVSIVLWVEHLIFHHIPSLCWNNIHVENAYVIVYGYLISEWPRISNLYLGIGSFISMLKWYYAHCFHW